MKIILFILLILNILLCKASFSQTREDSVNQRIEITRYDNGMKESERCYDTISGQLTVLREWSAEGVKTKETFFENGVVTTSWYLEDGHEVYDEVNNEVINRTINYKDGSKCILEIRRNKLLRRVCWDAEGNKIE